MVDNVLLLIGWLFRLWPLLVLIWAFRQLTKRQERGVSLWGSLLLVIGTFLGAAAAVWILGWIWGSVMLPKIESQAPVLAAQSRTADSLYRAVEDPCSIPGAGNFFCGNNPNRLGESGELASEQAQSAAGAPIVAAPSGPIPVLIGDPATPEGQALLLACWRSWYESPRVNGASRLSQGLPPEGGAKPSDWIPSTAGPGELVVETPVGVNNNRGVLRHWLLPSPVELTQDPLKALHPDKKGTWSVSGTGTWPETCYVAPTPEPLSTVAAPASPPSVSPPEGLTLFDAAGGQLFVPTGTPLTWCSQDPASGAWFACAPNQQWFWRP